MFDNSPSSFKTVDADSLDKVHKDINKGRVLIW